MGISSDKGYRKGSTALVAAMTLILPFLSLVLPGIGPVNVEAAPPPIGDWIINTEESLSNADIVLTGNLTVVFGGKLTLDNVAIRMNCTFNGQFNISVKTGGTLIMRNSTVTPVDFLQRYRYNFDIGIASTGDIYDSTLEAIGEGNLSRPNTLGLFIQSSSSRIVNNVFTRRNILYVATAIAIGPMASPLIKGNQISGLYPLGITTILGSKSLIKDNDITASGIGVACISSSPRIVSNDISSNLIGISLTSCDTKMEWNQFSGNVFSAVSSNQSDITMDRDVFSGNGNDMVLNFTGLRAKRIKTSGSSNSIEIDNGGSKSIRFTNSSLSNSVISINNSLVNMLNTVFDHDNIDLLSETGQLTVDWFLNLTVSYVTGGPVVGATVNIEDLDNVTVYQGMTDANGEIDLLEIEEYHQIGDVVTMRTPHEVIAAKGSITGNAEVVIDISKDIQIELDDLVPTVTILEPLEGQISNNSTVEFKGNATDNGQVSVVEYKLPGGPWNIANGTEDWNFTLQLQDGNHHLTVKAKDLSGNQGTDEVNITIDTIAPVLSITSPDDGALLNLSPVMVEGMTEPGIDLKVVGTNITIETDAKGGFSFSHNLSEGENNISLVARDRANNEVQRTIMVILDTIPPGLVITAPDDGIVTNISNLVVKGKTDSNGSVTVTVNGLPVTVDANGEFEHTLVLSDGNFSITITAKDMAGNSVSESRNVVIDTIPPGLEITAPADGLLTNVELLSVKGRAETSNVHIGQMLVEPVPDNLTGWWLIDELYPLNEGVNDIVIKAVDEAGNNRTMTLTVTLDTAPPDLTIIEPSDGTKTRKKEINIIGTTESGATLEIGNMTVTTTDGTFSLPFNLIVGENKISIRSTDDAGNSVERIITVTRQKTEYTSTPLEGGYSLLLVLLIIVVIGVFLMFFNYAKARKDHDHEEEEEELEMDEPPDLDEEKLEELKSLDANDVDDDGPEDLPPGPVPERSTLILGGQHIEPTSYRERSEYDFSSRPRDNDVLKDRPKKRSTTKKKKKKKKKK